MGTIFFAEGESHVSRAISLLFTYEEDFELIGQAADAEALLAQACLRPPDMILLDWALPGFHPQRLLKVLRQHCQETFIVATVVNLDQKRMALAHGVDAFIYKDQSPQDFMETLRSITQKSQKGPN